MWAKEACGENSASVFLRAVAGIAGVLSLQKRRAMRLYRYGHKSGLQARNTHAVRAVSVFGGDVVCGLAKHARGKYGAGAEQAKARGAKEKSGRREGVQGGIF